MLVQDRVTAHPSRPDADRWIEALGLAVVGVDAREAVRFANAAAVELLSGAGRGLVGRRLEEVFGRDAPILAIVRRALASGRTLAEADVVLAGPGFALGRADVTAASLEEGRFVAVTISPRPPSRMPLAPQLAPAAARTLAHEVRNPLAGIRAAAQLIGREANDEVAGLADLICAEVERIRRLTEQIDPVGTPHSRPLEVLNVHEVVDRVRRVIASGSPEIRLRERYDPSLPPVRGDADQLIQALLNIAKNAVEALKGHKAGEIVFSTGYRAGLRVRSAAGAPALPQLEIAVTDNGPGIAAEIADRLFEPFATTKSNGMGLGLALAADIVSRHGGRIEVHSTPGRTSFRLLLPIEPAGASDGPKTSEKGVE